MSTKRYKPEQVVTGKYSLVTSPHEPVTIHDHQLKESSHHARVTP